MRGRFVISFLFIVALASGCGFNPHPIDGTLSCNDGCPAGYVCRTAENRCWRASTPIADGGSDGVQPDRASVIFLDNSFQNTPVQII